MLCINAQALKTKSKAGGLQHFRRNLVNINAMKKVFDPDYCTNLLKYSPSPEVIKLFSCSTQLSTKLQLLIKTKIPTNEEVSCFKAVICYSYHADKC